MTANRLTQLENVIERTVLLNKDEVLLPEHLVIEKVDRSGEEKGSSSASNGSVKEMEKELILKTLEELEGNRTHAARALGISIRTLRNKLKEYQGWEGIRA